MIRKVLFKVFLFSALVSSFGCEQTSPTNNLNLTSTIEAIQTIETPIEKSSPDESPAVIYRSIDLGATWSSFDRGIPKEATLSGIKQDGKKLYVTTDYHGVFVSVDGQDNWMALNEKRLSGLDINCIEVEDDNLIIGTLNKGILVSTDGGLNWKQPKNNINSPIRAFIKSENKMYAGTDSGIFESVDKGASWSPTFGQMQILGFTSLNKKIYAATQSGALLLNGENSNWKSIYEGDALHDIGNDGKYIYAMTIGQQLLKTQNDGASWEKAQNGIARPPNYYTNEIQHIGTTIFSAQWIGIYESIDNGDHWKKLNGLPDSTAFSTLQITDFGIIAGISIR